MRRRLLAVLMVSLLVSHAAYAQQMPTDDPFAEAPIRIGAVAIDPRVEVRDVGIDTNVFNATENEQRDFTFTIAPGSMMWLRTGKGLLTLDGGVEFVYFSEFDSERSANSDVLAQYELRFNRLRPYASAYSLNTRQRPGYEIDVRARHYETDIHAGTDLRVASKGTVRVDYRHLDYRFAGDEVFGGRPLNQELNRTLQAIDLGWRQRLTALTTWVTRFTRESERFEFDERRNSNSFRMSSGFELGRLALIRGAAFVGFRTLKPAAGGFFPEFSGVIADVDVSYTAPSQTRLSAAVDRDIQYSYEDRTPYYIQTGWTATVTQRLVSRWDAQLSGGRDRLSYQAIDPSHARRDFVGRFGGGIGYEIGEQVRASFNVQSFYRRADLRSREYGNIRFGVTVTYGY